jgi:hypothetical protein
MQGLLSSTLQNAIPAKCYPQHLARLPATAPPPQPTWRAMCSSEIHPGWMPPSAPSASGLMAVSKSFANLSVEWWSSLRGVRGAVGGALTIQKVAHLGVRMYAGVGARVPCGPAPQKSTGC